MSGKAHNEQITSGFPATADIARTLLNGRFVPKADIILVEGELLPFAGSRSIVGVNDM
jgi:hypothetical protein